MRVAQTIWRLGCAGSWLVLLAACNPRSKRAQPSPQLSAQAVAPPSASSSRAASAIAEVLRSVHEDKLQVVAPGLQTSRLSFGRAGLLQASGSKVILRELKQGDSVAEASLGAVRAVARGADGALFALGASGSVRFGAGKEAPRRFGHVTFFPSSGLYPDLERPDFLYVYDPAQQVLYRYAFDSDAAALAPIAAQVALEGCTAALSQLRDGAFVCRSANGIVRKAPRGAKSELKLPPSIPEPFRLLPAPRLDEVFAVSRAGEVVHVRLERGTPELGRFQLPAPPFAAVANAEALAFILVSPPAPGVPRRWSLLVTDLTGQARFGTDLAEKGASAGEDWMEAIIEDKNLAISESGPLVAVGGADRVQVWDYEKSALVFAR
jgi:hypothetical protein